jgi:hypothetical protein
VDRTVEHILTEWREAEREHEGATDPETREAVEARIARLAEEHRRAVDERMPDEEPPELGGLRSVDA